MQLHNGFYAIGQTVIKVEFPYRSSTVFSSRKNLCNYLSHRDPLFDLVAITNRKLSSESFHSYLYNYQYITSRRPLQS